MKILGIDPGSWHTGVGLIETQGSRYRLVHAEVIRIAEGSPLPERLRQIHEAVRKILEAYRPDILALETAFFGKDVQALVHIGEARAAAMLAASEVAVPVVEYSPARVKQAVSGNGRASKEQIQQMVRRLLALQAAPPSDAADALAVAICHAHARPSQAALELAEKKLKAASGGTKKRRRRVPLAYGNAD